MALFSSVLRQPSRLDINLRLVYVTYSGRKNGSNHDRCDCLHSVQLSTVVFRSSQVSM